MGVALDTAILLTGESLIWFTDRWRSRSLLPVDPPLTLSKAIPPHVTLLSPWHLEPANEEAAGSLRHAVSAVEPFALQFGSVATFPAGTVYLKPESSPELHALFETLADAFPEFPPYGGTFERWLPHMTVSREGGEAVADEVRVELAGVGPLTLVVREVSAWELLPSGRWAKRLSAPLAA